MMDKKVPSFQSPPVTETVLSLEFAPVGQLGFVGLSGFYRRISEWYPNFEEQILYPANGYVGDAPTIGEFGPRLWMTSADSANLVQAQADRIVLNWRRVEGGSEYGRYATQRARLRELANILEQQLAEAPVPEAIVPLWVESSYVNLIDFEDGQRPHDFFEVLRSTEHLPGRAKYTRHHEVRDLQSEDGNFLGSLLVLVEPRSADDQIGAVLTVTTRISLNNVNDLRASFDALDFAHETSVFAFDAATTHGMHEKWGREE